MHRLIRPVLLAAIASIACSKGADSPRDAGPSTCTTLADCAGSQVCLNSTCVAICHSTSECQTAATPNNVCEEGVCLSPACGNDSQCGSGQSCLDGKCAQKPVGTQVASCDVTPNPGDVRVGSTLQMTAIPRDADGNVLNFSGATWAASGSNTISTDGVLTANGPAGTDITVTATAGTRTCTSTVHAYGTVASGSLRVTAINQHTKEPIEGAKVIVCNAAGTCGAAVTTAHDGTITATADTSNDVHVFASGYNYTSFVKTTATDLLVPLAPFIATNARSGFTSHLCDSKADDAKCTAAGEFAPLQDQGEAVHLAFFGSGIPNSLLDLSLSTLLGPLHTVHLQLAGQSKDLDLPYGLVLGVATSFFDTNDPHVFADSGIRSLWGIGGNVNLSKVVTILSPLLAPNATVDIGALLPQLLGFFNRLEAGAVVGVKAPANGPTPSFVNKPIPLTTPMRLRYDVTSPALPTLDGNYVDGVIAVAGAMNYPLGFVPLGLSAGLSSKDGHGGVLDPTCDAAAPCNTNLLPLKFAPENGGTEGSPVAIGLLALNFGGLTPGSTAKIAISGQIAMVPNASLVYTPPGSAVPKLTPPAFMKLPGSSSIAVTKSDRTVKITGDADPSVQIYRFELANAARLNWEVWTPKAGSAIAVRSFKLPDPGFSIAVDCNAMTALCDPFADAKADDGTTHGPGARLLALQLTSPDTAAQLETFSNPLRLDELGASLKAFTALQVDVSP